MFTNPYSFLHVDFSISIKITSFCFWYFYFCPQIYDNCCIVLNGHIEKFVIFRYRNRAIFKKNQFIPYKNINKNSFEGIQYFFLFFAVGNLILQITILISIVRARITARWYTFSQNIYFRLFFSPSVLHIQILPLQSLGAANVCVAEFSIILNCQTSI